MELYDFVEVLKPFKTTWCIRVNVLKRWITRRIPRRQKLKMILVDEMGCKIQASIANHLILENDSNLRKNQWVCIRNFSLHNSYSDRRPTTHDYKIHFLCTTVVTPLPNLSDNLYLSTVDFSAVLRSELDWTFAIDLIGYVSKIIEFNIYDPSKKTVDYALLLFEMRNSEDEIIECLAVGELAEEINHKLTEAIGEGVICVLRWWYINTDQATRSFNPLGGLARYW